MKLKLFARPEDVDPETAYKSNMWTLYATNTEVEDIDVDRLRGRCHVALNDDVKPGAKLRFTFTRLPYILHSTASR